MACDHTTQTPPRPHWVRKDRRAGRGVGCVRGSVGLSPPSYDADPDAAHDGGPMTRPRPATHLTAAAVLLASLSLAACGSDEPPAVCSSVDALEASVAALTSVQVEPGALTQLRDDFAQVQSDLGRVRDDAGEEFASEIDSVEQSTASVGASLEAAVTSPSTQAISDVGAAVQALGTSLSALEEAVTTTC